MTDPKGDKTATAYDELNRPVRIVEAAYTDSGPELVGMQKWGHSEPAPIP